jgi:hypothetical protein
MKGLTKFVCIKEKNSYIDWDCFRKGEIREFYSDFLESCPKMTEYWCYYCK